MNKQTLKAMPKIRKEMALWRTKGLTDEETVSRLQKRFNIARNEAYEAMIKGRSGQ